MVTESKPYFVWRKEPLVGAPYDYGWWSYVVYPYGQDGRHVHSVNSAF
jgi:hypothetical protein